MVLKQFARFVLFLSGWKVDRNVPAEASRCVMIAAPHTSNFDAWLLRLCFWVLKIPMKVAIKDDWTRFPFGLIVKPLGGVGVNRSPKAGNERMNQVDEMAELFNRFEKIALVIAPEGTRKKRDRWKTGFYWIAKKAAVPITFGYLDYKNKRAGVGPVALYPGDDVDSDMRVVMNFYKNIHPRMPDSFATDKRYS